MFVESEEARNRLEALAHLETHLSFRISRLSKLLDNQAARLLTGSGLTLTGYRILFVLSIFRETTAADLSRLMVMDRAQISRAVSGLIGEGSISNRPDPTNRRKRLLRVTESGRDKAGWCSPTVPGAPAAPGIASGRRRAGRPVDRDRQAVTPSGARFGPSGGWAGFRNRGTGQRRRSMMTMLSTGATAVRAGRCRETASTPRCGIARALNAG